MSPLEFGEPPKRRAPANAAYPWNEWAHELRARPGEWARLPIERYGRTQASKLAHYINQGRLVGLTERGYRPMGPGYEAFSRSVDGQRQLWARYVGPLQ